MKNIHILQTDKPSRLSDCHNNKLHLDDVRYLRNYQNIYITSDEEIREGDFFLHPFNTIHKAGGNLTDKDFKKIILTTNQDLIKDGVQAIDDEFLEWFVKNPSCEDIEIKKCINTTKGLYRLEYKIIILKEEPKQENKVLVEMQQILRRDSKFMGHYESCDLCHYNAFFKYLYNGEILYRCQGHKIVNINNLKSKFGFGSEEPKQETLEIPVKPIGDFIIENATPTEGQDGAYYHYSEVCKLLKLQERMYSEEDMKQFGLYLGDNLKKLKGKTIDEIFKQFKKK